MACAVVPLLLSYQLPIIKKEKSHFVCVHRGVKSRAGLWACLNEALIGSAGGVPQLQSLVAAPWGVRAKLGEQEHTKVGLFDEKGWHFGEGDPCTVSLGMPPAFPSAVLLPEQRPALAMPCSSPLQPWLC